MIARQLDGFLVHIQADTASELLVEDLVHLFWQAVDLVLLFLLGRLLDFFLCVLLRLNFDFLELCRRKNRQRDNY